MSWQAASFALLAEFHDGLWERTGIGPERTILAGFSMGAVMSYALGLHADRPRPAGILAFSGFVPTVEGWEPSLAFLSRSRPAKGTASETDEWAKAARKKLDHVDRNAA